MPYLETTVGQLARSRGVYSESGPEPGLVMDSESRVFGVSPLVTGKDHVAGVLPASVLVPVGKIYLACGLCQRCH